VGDNVGDIAGMGSDLFGSFAESTVAALVVSGNSVDLIRGANFLYPLIVSSIGILVCLITTSFTPLFSIKQDQEDVKCIFFNKILNKNFYKKFIILKFQK